MKYEHLKGGRSAEIRLDLLTYVTLIAFLTMSIQYVASVEIAISFAAVVAVLPLLEFLKKSSLDLKQISRSLRGQNSHSTNVVAEKNLFQPGQLKAETTPDYFSKLNGNSPSVSIIVPFFNAERYLEDAVKSALLTQQFPFEIILVDDGSEDGSIDIGRRFETDFSPVSLVTLSQNYGAYVARNVGLERARGDFVAFLDSDDVQSPLRLYRQIVDLRKHPNGVFSLCHGMRWTEDFSRPLTSERKIFASLTYPRRLVNQIGYFDSVRWGADSEYIARIEAYFGPNSARELNENLYFARYRSGSLTSAETSAVFGMKKGVLMGNMSPARRAYKRNYNLWHLSSKPDELKMPFPQTGRMFPLGDDSQAATEFSAKAVIEINSETEDPDESH